MGGVCLGEKEKAAKYLSEAHGMLKDVPQWLTADLRSRYGEAYRAYKSADYPSARRLSEELIDRIGIRLSDLQTLRRRCDDAESAVTDLEKLGFDVSQDEVVVRQVRDFISGSLVHDREVVAGRIRGYNHDLEVLLTKMRPYVDEYRSLQEKLNRARTHLKEVKDMVPSNYVAELEAKMASIESSAFGKVPIDDVRSAVKSVIGEVENVEENFQRDRHTVRMDLKRCLDHAKVMARWCPQVPPMVESIGRLIDRMDRERFVPPLDEAGSLILQVENLYSSKPTVSLKLDFKYGYPKRGIWCTVDMSIKNDAQFRVIVNNIRFPDEVQVRLRGTAVELDSGESRLVRPTLRFPEIGTFPLSVSASVRPMWSQDPIEIEIEEVVRIEPETAPARTMDHMTYVPQAVSVQAIPVDHTCSSCGKSLKAGWKRCPFCGASRTVSGGGKDGTCPGCGKPVLHQWKVCPSCSKSL